MRPNILFVFSDQQRGYLLLLWVAAADNAPSGRPGAGRAL